MTQPCSSQLQKILLLKYASLWLQSVHFNLLHSKTSYSPLTDFTVQTLLYIPYENNYIINFVLLLQLFDSNSLEHLKTYKTERPVNSASLSSLKHHVSSCDQKITYVDIDGCSLLILSSLS